MKQSVGIGMNRTGLAMHPLASRAMNHGTSFGIEVRQSMLGASSRRRQRKKSP